jgi:Arylsulfotransferase (ASST)
VAVSEPPPREGVTRRQLLGAGGLATLAIAGVGVGVGELTRRSNRAVPLPAMSSFAVGTEGSAHAFHSQPHLRPPTVTTSFAASTDGATGRPAAAHAARPGDPEFLFLGPGPVSLATGSTQYGPLIIDRAGTPVWFRPLPSGLQVTNFTASEYRGEPVLVWWEGKILESGYGQGEAVLVDRSYREITRVRAAGGRAMDLHALTLTPQGTALFTCYPESVTMDLSSMNGPKSDQVLGSIIQEVDVASGRLLWEWHGLQHIPVTDTEEPMAAPYDYLHINSIQPLSDGNLFVSARHTWAAYKLDRRTGDVIWTLGGKKSNFQMGPGAQFAWQHDAVQVSDTRLTVFDNGTNGPLKTEPQARGLELVVDESRRTATFRRAYTTADRLLPGAMGSVQILPSGNVMVGWGVDSLTSEFTADGALLYGASLPQGMYSYRGLRLPWTAAPHHAPAVAAARDTQSGAAVLYASWNGATDVAGWEVNAGSEQRHLRPLGIARRHGFETVIPLKHQPRFVSVTPVDRTGKRLRHSPVIKL